MHDPQRCQKGRKEPGGCRRTAEREHWFPDLKNPDVRRVQGQARQDIPPVVISRLGLNSGPMITSHSTKVLILKWSMVDILAVPVHKLFRRGHSGAFQHGLQARRGLALVPAADLLHQRQELPFKEPRFRQLRHRQAGEEQQHIPPRPGGHLFPLAQFEEPLEVGKTRFPEGLRSKSVGRPATAVSGLLRGTERPLHARAWIWARVSGMW